MFLVDERIVTTSSLFSHSTVTTLGILLCTCIVTDWMSQVIEDFNKVREACPPGVVWTHGLSLSLSTWDYTILLPVCSIRYKWCTKVVIMVGLHCNCFGNVKLLLELKYWMTCAWNCYFWSNKSISGKIRVVFNIFIHLVVRLRKMSW